MYKMASNLVSMRRRSDKKPQNIGEKPENQVYNSILDLVGNTPLVKLEKLPKAYNVNCDIYAKCEFFNPSGSIKDRLALGMMQDAKRKGIVNETTEYIEATSGNTGIGIAINCALSENRCIIVTEDKNSSEKVNTVKLLGAEVIQTKNNSLEISIARKLVDELPDAVMLGQFENPVNPRTHYETTAKEILSAMSPIGDIDMLVVGSGTGGTMSGIGKRLKEVNPKCLVVVNEPEGSTMFNKNAKAHPFLVEGIGGTSVPLVCDDSVMDHYEVISDKDAFVMARDLARMEGLLCGGSSGSAMTAAIKAVKNLFHDGGRGKSVVVILPDGIRNYMSKFVSDQWMEAYRFIDPPKHTMRWWNNPITDLIPSHKYPKLHKDYTCEQTLEAMKTNNVDIGVMVDENNRYLGAVSKDGLRNRATNPTKLPGQKSEEFDFQSLVIDSLDKHVHILAENAKEGKPTVGLLSRILDITPYVVIGKEIRDYFEPSGVVTVDDVLNYIHEKSKPVGFNKTWYK